MAKSGEMSGFVGCPAVLIGDRVAIWLGNSRVAARSSAFIGKNDPKGTKFHQ